MTKRNRVRFLIVDDQGEVLSTLQRMLVLEGFRCAIAGSLDQLAECLGSLQFDFAIVDHDMPGFDVGVAVSLIRERMPDATLIGHSGRCRREDFMAVGVSKFLQKPWTLSQLYALFPHLQG